MAHVTDLTSNDNPRIKAVAKLRDQRHRRDRGLFCVESMRQLERAAHAGLVLRELYLCPDLLGISCQAALEKVHAWIGTPPPGDAFAVFAVTAALLRKMVVRENPDGVVGVIHTPIRQTGS